MKKFCAHNLKKIYVIGLLLLIFSSILVFAFSGGITGRTLKTTTAGCSCHNVSATPDVVVTIAGPDSVNKGSTTNYSITITRASKTGAGLDVATRSGTLGVVSSNTHVSNGELVHSNNIAMTGGTVTLQFSYTAPNTLTTDTIWATGIATNSDNSTSGDDWNWAPSKRVIVRNPIGIKPISSEVPSSFELQQNYPNPFNPSTVIGFSVPKASFVKLDIIDISGQLVETLVNENLQSGSYRITLNGSNYASGAYFCKMTAGKFSQTRRMILAK